MIFYLENHRIDNAVRRCLSDKTKWFYQIIVSVQAFVFPLCRHPAPDVPLPLVFVQHLPGLGVQAGIALAQPLGQIFVHRGFGNAEMLGGGADRGAGFDHVHSQFTGSLA